MGFQLSVILALLCLLMVFQTNKAHPAGQSQLPLLPNSASKACVTETIHSSTIWGNTVRQEDAIVTHSDKRTLLREMSGSGCHMERHVTKGLSQQPQLKASHAIAGAQNHALVQICPADVSSWPGRRERGDLGLSPRPGVPSDPE